MDIFSVFIAALITVSALLVILLKAFELRKLLGFEVWLDIAFTVIIPLIFAKSTFGILVGVTTGLMLSLILRGLRRIYGCKKLEFRNGQLVWVAYTAH